MLSDDSFSAGVFRLRDYADAPRVEADEPPPLRGERLPYPPCLRVAVHLTAEPDVRVQGREERVDVRLPHVAAELPRLPYAPVHDAAVHVHPVHPYVHPEAFHALGVVLAVELALVQPRAEGREPPPQFGDERERHFPVVGHYGDVIHETLEADAPDGGQPLVDFVEVPVHGVLPDEEAYRRARALRLREEALFGRYEGAFLRCGEDAAMCRRIAEDAGTEDVEKLVAVAPVIAGLYDFAQLGIGDVLTYVREAALQVELHHPRVAAREPAAHLVYVRDYGVLASLLPHPDAVVEGVRAEPSFKQRAEADVEVVVENPRGHVGGEHLAGPRGHGYKCVGGRPQASADDIAVQGGAVRLPVQLEVRLVGRPPFVGAGDDVCVNYVLQFNHCIFLV